MKGGTQAALALGVGYMLGRQRKMRMATVMAAAVATGSLGGLTGAVLRRGVKMLGSSEALSNFAPQLGELADTVRGDLMDAGKAAATAAVTNRIESLTDSLHERAEMVRDPSAAVSGAGKAARSGAGKAAGAASATLRRPRRGRVADEEEAAETNGEETEPGGEEDLYAEDLDEQDDYEEPEAAAEGEPEAEEEEPKAEEEEPEAEEEEADEPAPAPVRRRSTRRRSPVARAGR